MSIFIEQRVQPPSRVAPVSCALLLHAGVLACMAHVPATSLAPMRLPGTSRGTHLSLTYAPGRASQRAMLSKTAIRQPPKTAPAPAALPLLPTKPQVSASTGVSSTSQTNPASDNDALGTGNVNIALAIKFPTPKPDLTSPPHGTVGDVVVDIVIDAEGRVASVTMSHGLGHGIDETVVATVQQWSFHPATRDGKPVPSEQEPHFHYERG